MHPPLSGRLEGVCFCALRGTSKKALLIILHPPLSGRLEGVCDTPLQGTSKKVLPIVMHPPLSGRLWGVFDTPLQGTSKKRDLTTKKPGTRRKNPATHPAFFTFRLGRYALSLSDVGDRNNIGKHTRCSHVGTGAVALDNHRILVITLGGDHNNVVASLQFVERMGATNLL